MQRDQVQSSMTASATQIRPSTAELIELHVYCVPEELWNSKLNNVSPDLINKFISVGFIRVSPDMKLRTLRERLGEFLGDDALVDKFVFLKCVGRSMAVVKAKQEQDLKLKLFAPPYAIQPELYLLPGADYEGSTYGSSITPDDQQNSAEYTGFNGSVLKGLTVPERDQSISPNESNKKAAVHSQEEKDDDTFIWNRKGQEVVPNINMIQYQGDVQSKENHIVSTRKETPIVAGKKMEHDCVSKDIKKLPGRNTTTDSGISESLGDRELENPHWKRQEQLSSTDLAKSPTGKQTDQFGDNSPRLLLQPAQYLSPPFPPVLAFPTIKSPIIKVPTHRPLVRVYCLGEAVQEQLNQLKEERNRLEKSREELVKKAKALLEQYKLRRYQARDSWKKKYFETKKATCMLEETLHKRQRDFEVYYQKLLTQLAARDNKIRSKYPTLAANSKNRVIIQITTKQHDIDQLKRKLDNARIKLIIEMKMRKQASLDLNVLKAELAQKKAQSSITNHPVFAR
ncbi:spermatogenesis-associated protein 1 isoform X2 [Ascaphus truei]|uniref:spermatogenesis-associated protein 1 isoform X2 n=1 Tax=Ascaphus truei TaxID=8439 RepID=UPI003F590940